jgi:hypothetical protein
MGFSISWVGFKGLSRTELLRRTGFRDSGTAGYPYDSPFSLAALPTGWMILFANDVDFGAAEHLIGLSAGARLLSCQAEEHVMFSAAHACTDGQALWSVWHDAQSGMYHLSTAGRPPAELEAILLRLTAQQDAAGGGRSMVDYIFDIPVELAADLTGYRDGQASFAWGEPRFTILERAR